MKVYDFIPVFKPFAITNNYYVLLIGGWKVERLGGWNWIRKLEGSCKTIFWSYWCAMSAEMAEGSQSRAGERTLDKRGQKSCTDYFVKLLNKMYQQIITNYYCLLYCRLYCLCLKLTSSVYEWVWLDACWCVSTLIFAGGWQSCWTCEKVWSKALVPNCPTPERKNW